MKNKFILSLLSVLLLSTSAHALETNLFDVVKVGINGNYIGNAASITNVISSLNLVTTNNSQFVTGQKTFTDPIVIQGATIWDSGTNATALVIVNGGTGIQTNQGARFVFSGSIYAPSNVAPYIVSTTIPAAVNSIHTNLISRGWVNASINLTPAAAGIGQVTLRVANLGGGNTQDIQTISVPANAAATTFVLPLTGFIQTNQVFWITNQSTSTGTATLNLGRFINQ